MTQTGQLPSWPPSSLNQAQVAALAAQATDWALFHGLIYRPAAQPPPSTHSHHAPISLLPSPFPQSAFETALELQPLLNELYARIALDDAFLTQVIGGNVAKVDDFQKRLWQVYRRVMDEGNEPQWHLGLFRSDYLMHSDPSSSSSSSSGTPTVRQVEFNTISASFGPLCAKVSNLHRSLLQQTGYYDAAPDVIDPERMPSNTALRLLSDGLAHAHETYLSQNGQSKQDSSAVRILFVVQERERNAFDQRALEFDLLERHGIRSTRKTFTSLINDCEVASGSSALMLTDGASSSKSEISTVYYRAGYSPDDYSTEEHWNLRLRIERSRAIKCPTVALQLAGAKKVQQVLAEPGVVERFLPRRQADEIEKLRTTWADLYPLDDSSELGREGLRLATQHSERFVMKPQREGGGNNIYRGDIPKALKEMEARDAQRSQAGGAESTAVLREREGYILMELIVPPSGLGNYLLRPPVAGSTSSSPSTADSGSGTQTVLSGGSSRGHAEGLTTAECRLSPDVVSELGVYGAALFRRGSGPSSPLDESSLYSTPQPTTTTKSASSAPMEAAYLLRTKGRESDEGGVAVGFSVLDSLVLI